MTYVSVEVSKGRRGRRQKIRLLVDTGAADSILPTRLLRRLGIRPEWHEEYELANGESMRRDVGRMYIHYGGRSVETLVVFGEPGDASVLGAYSMEGLRLEVDPHTGRVRRMRKLLAVRASVAHDDHVAFGRSDGTAPAAIRVALTWGHARRQRGAGRG